MKYKNIYILPPFEDVSKNYQYSIKNNDISNNFIYTVYRVLLVIQLLVSCRSKIITRETINIESGASTTKEEDISNFDILGSNFSIIPEYINPYIKYLCKKKKESPSLYINNEFLVLDEILNYDIKQYSNSVNIYKKLEKFTGFGFKGTNQFEYIKNDKKKSEGLLKKLHDIVTDKGEKKNLKEIKRDLEKTLTLEKKYGIYSTNNLSQELETNITSYIKSNIKSFFGKVWRTAIGTTISKKYFDILLVYLRFLHICRLGEVIDVLELLKIEAKKKLDTNPLSIIKKKYNKKADELNGNKPQLKIGFKDYIKQLSKDLSDIESIEKRMLEGITLPKFPDDKKDFIKHIKVDPKSLIEKFMYNFNILTARDYTISGILGIIVSLITAMVSSGAISIGMSIGLIGLQSAASIVILPGLISAMALIYCFYKYRSYRIENIRQAGNSLNKFSKELEEQHNKGTKEFKKNIKKIYDTMKIST